jgi:hypothetical protein
MNAVLALLDRPEKGREDLPFDWDVIVSHTLGDYDEQILTNPDIVVIYSSPDLSKIHDGVLINKARRAGVRLIVLLTEEKDYPLPAASEAELVIYFNKDEWSFANGRLNWVRMIETCRRAAEVGCA